MKNAKVWKNPDDSRCIYQNGLHKTWFQHDMAYGDFKDLSRRTISDKVLYHKAFNIAKHHKYDAYPKVLASIVSKSIGKILQICYSYRPRN